MGEITIIVILQLQYYSYYMRPFHLHTYKNTSETNNAFTFVDENLTPEKIEYAHVCNGGEWYRFKWCIKLRLRKYRNFPVISTFKGDACENFPISRDNRIVIIVDTHVRFYF